MTFGTLNIKIKECQMSGGEFLANKKMGRPTDNPKTHRMGVRLDNETKEILDKYCKQESVTQMEATRRGIRKLKDDLKN